MKRPGMKREDLLRYKRDLEIELARVAVALDSGVEADVKGFRINRNWLGLKKTTDLVGAKEDSNRKRRADVFYRGG